MHIILYVLDALRADHLGCYGYARETSPNIDRLAGDGVLFENCFTSTTWTRPVAASILTGTYPAVHQTRSRYDMFSTNLARLPEVLKASGYKTAAFSTMGNIASEIGFSRGFDYYYDLFREPAVLARRRLLNAAREGLMHAPDDKVALPCAEDINEYLLPWLAEHRSNNTFSFAWSIETHEPYRAPEAFRRFAESLLQPGEGESEDIRGAGKADRQRLINLYDDVIYYNDHCLGQIIDHLKQLNIYQDTLFIIVGDHGDAFYEHGFYAHGHAPYEELIHVPMIIKFPDGRFAGRRVSGLAELTDLFPTVTAVAGLTPGTAGSAFIQGCDLQPLAAGQREEVREHVFSDTQSLQIHNHYLSVRSREWKYIQLQRPKRDGQTFARTVKHILERGILLDILRRPRHFLRGYFGGVGEYLFNLEDDPGEQNNLAAERSDLVHQFRQILKKWQDQNNQIGQQLDNLPYSYEESESLQRHLERLGYL